jgi:hypothetical protein
MDNEKMREENVTIIDKDEDSDKAMNVVSGFIIEESTNPFPNGKLSFVPEDYGKKDSSTPTPTTRVRSRGLPKIDPSLPPGKSKCEMCGEIGNMDSFLAPSRRFCTVTCCKRYSAEKRYYPYGKDEEGVEMSIREGLVNPHRSLRPNSSKARRVWELICIILSIPFYSCSFPPSPQVSYIALYLVLGVCPSL